MKQKRNMTEDQLRKVVPLCLSYTAVLRELGYQITGGNHQSVKKKIADLGLDISHMTHACWSKGKKIPSKISVEEYLSNRRNIHSAALKQKLFKEGLKLPVCEVCGLDSWLDNPLPLELHHKDGEHFNNSLDNLLIVCPNCHAVETKQSEATRRIQRKKKLHPA